ncbi:hypothetical protein AN217_26645 [Streptomyces qinglanensis]|uniref:Uncharacterized protein n=1 Tax=Streptomyces qinglanensis TaxID=943816 RepID=A0A1E7KA36_9ACTN|nr:hypothetical protein [Streptomyces qinglanensis]OEV00786.1 hypothetical protein AN217_26645 [Streptomyces qinglanensis]OEV28558.1 hypothetical protein AN220_01110 [Streptomyces nanshensis]
MDTRTLRQLIAEAENSGFSRKGTRTDLSADQDTQYLLVPVLPESIPSDSWICALLAYAPATVGERHSPFRRIPHRLDVAPRSFERLKTLSRRQKNQLLHALIWEVTSPTLPARKSSG